MKKIFFIFFVVSGCLVAMNNQSSKGFLKINIHDHFQTSEINGYKIPQLTQQAIIIIYKNCINSNDEVEMDRVAYYLNNIASLGYNEGFNDKYNEKFNEGFKYYQSLYDSNPKKVGLAVLGIIIVGSVIYTGTKLFYFGKEKFSNSRNSEKK